MSTVELHRLQVVQRVAERRLTVTEAAQQLSIRRRQMTRFVAAYRSNGAAGIVSRRRGKRSNRSFHDDFRQTVLSLIRDNYADFGPTLAAEKLGERHDVELSDETARQWMIGSGGSGLIVKLVSRGCTSRAIGAIVSAS